MITPEYIKGYISALKTIQENVDGRLNELKRFNEDEYHGVFGRVSELTSVKLHIEQVRESYRQLVEKANNENKNKAIE